MPKPERFPNFMAIRPSKPFPGGGRYEMLIHEDDCEGRLRAELVELAPGEGFPVHTHPQSDHVIVVVSGNGVLMWEHERRPICAGDTFVVPRGDIHSISASSDSPFRFVVVNVPPVAFHSHEFMRPVASR